MLERYFRLSAHGSNVQTEVMAGITTFLTMAYIIFVNPDILSAAGMPKDAVFVATCLAAAIGTAIIFLQQGFGRAAVIGEILDGKGQVKFAKPVKKSGECSRSFPVTSRWDTLSNFDMAPGRVICGLSGSSG